MQDENWNDSSPSSSVDTPEETIDNNDSTSYPSGEKLYFDKANFKKVFDPTGCEHKFEKDDTEDTPTYYGIQCKKCKIGKLIRKD